MIRATMISADDQQPDGEGMAGRPLLVADAVVPAAVHQACAELAARLADQAGLPVTVSTVPIGRLDAILDSIGRDAALGAPGGHAADADREMLAEMRRGIRETTGLYAESAEPGWLAVTCESPRMAAWMCAATGSH